jgi:hypothetical protein
LPFSNKDLRNHQDVLLTDPQGRIIDVGYRRLRFEPGNRKGSLVMENTGVDTVPPE